MNTVGSVYYGWAFFIAAGAGSYYFAKKSINADREQRQRDEVTRLAKQRRDLEAYERNRVGVDAGKRGDEESEFEAKRPYRSRKGDRFS